MVIPGKLLVKFVTLKKRISSISVEFSLCLKTAGRPTKKCEKLIAKQSKNKIIQTFLALYFTKHLNFAENWLFLSIVTHTSRMMPYKTSKFMSGM
jgi:hypothetical protein